MKKVHEKFRIVEEVNDDGFDQYRIIAPVEDDSWRGAQDCTIAIIYEKEIAYKYFGGDK